MSDKKPDAAPETAGPEKKKSDKLLYIGLAVVFLMLALAYNSSLGPIPVEEQDASVEEAQVEDSDVEAVEQAFNTDDAVEDTVESSETAASSPFDLKAAKKERILGDLSAPIKIAEHSSLSCGHCGKFHRETLPAFKKTYIDTGKAYIVFSDFPLNAPALHASMSARCVPEDRFFDYTEELFSKQDDWAYDNNYLSYLQDKSSEYGLNKADFEACVQNKELQEALLNRMKAVQGQWDVRSTPSFVINNQIVVSGALSPEDFEKAIQDALTQIEAENSNEGG